ncbi:hypothetical protein [Gilvimarinus sp. 1_MG-2023]|uniref:hypothetical protein n=1 Tax=Gilvimarinus sp. 1_MG-2023 TaxID=3062638 RepID=UPI0026E1E1E2|nr:hypothetical protein [Gilvimarinus sp. 1_MG-2023]MDO6748453.1 hypothetical protein [Gilvimarinus sp. 1_MG-2023]
MIRPKKKAKAILKTISYRDCPAKSFNNNGNIIVGRSVESHCQIVGEVAKEVIRRSPVSDLFPEGAAFAAATHDIGKVSPTFYNKIINACSEEQIPHVNFELEKTGTGMQVLAN